MAEPTPADVVPGGGRPCTKLLPRSEGPPITTGQVCILLVAIFIKGGLLGAYLPYVSLWMHEKGYSAHDLALVAVMDSAGCFLLPVIGTAVDSMRLHNTGFVVMLVALALLKACYIPAAGSLMLLLVLTGMTAPLLRAANCVLDALALHAFAEKGHFARVRLVGDLGWGVLALGVGVAMDVSHNADIVFVVFACCCCLLAATWTVARPWMSSIRPDNRRMSLAEYWVHARELAVLGAQPPVLRVFGMMVLCGAAGGLIGTYELVLLRQMPGGTGSLLGLCKMTGTIAAIPAWWTVSPIMDVVGLKNVQLVTVAVLGLRLYILGVISTPVQALWSEALAGFGGFAAAYSSITIFAGRLVDEDVKGSAQTIIFTVYSGIGAGLGPALGSLLADSHGVQPMFEQAALVFFAVVSGIAAYDLLELLAGRYRHVEDAVQDMRDIDRARSPPPTGPHTSAGLVPPAAV